MPYDNEEGDPWHGPTMSVETVAHVTGVLASHAALGWPVPSDLETLWRWCEAGHWPCAVRDGRLVVY